MSPTNSFYHMTRINVQIDAVEILRTDTEGFRLIQLDSQDAYISLRSAVSRRASLLCENLRVSLKAPAALRSVSEYCLAVPSFSQW